MVICQGGWWLISIRSCQGTNVHCWLLILLLATSNRYKPKNNMSTFIVLLEFSLGVYSHLALVRWNYKMHEFQNMKF